MPCDDPYSEDYFMRGKASGKSLYENYRWLPAMTVPMVKVIVNHLGIGTEDTVLDFGCARGYIVKALRFLGHTAHGVDVSRWAIDNADEDVRQYVRHSEDSLPMLAAGFTWIIAKDVLEHVPQAAGTITHLMDSASKGVFAIVPLGRADGEPYVVMDYELDVTHIHRLTLASWARLFIRPGWSVEMRYRLPGVKDNYYKCGWEKGNGFITCRRLD